MRIAVVGSGISGLGAAWLLSQNNEASHGTTHEVTLFEADSRLGGHAHTYLVDETIEKGLLHPASSAPVPMDTGFLVYNELTYPNLVGFFKALGVETEESDMSLSVRVESKKLEWSGTSLSTIFSQRKNLLNLGFYKMLREILRFGKEAEDNRFQARRHGWSLGELLKNRKFSNEFAQDYLLPIGAAIWSTPEGKMLDFPAETFITFFINHKLLQVNDRPVWRTVKGGSIEYVKKAASIIKQIHLNSPVKSVERGNGTVIVNANGERHEFDRVILATHAPITAKILANQTEAEKRILGAIAYEPNQTWLHRADETMPKAKRCWSAWNVLGVFSQNQSQKVSLTYFLNKLQKLRTKNNYFVTLNPENQPKDSIKEFLYSHPQFDQVAIRAQRDLLSIQGAGGVYYAGAWTRYGFHEDGLLSAVNVAKLLQVSIPWEVS